MTAFPDTSFLCAFYVRQSNSPAAAAATMREPLSVTELLLCEFRRVPSVSSLAAGPNPREGLSVAETDAALRQLDEDLEAGMAVKIACPIPEVLRLADELSRRHTRSHGYRSFDILHVATAVIAGAREFLSFDARQRDLAGRAGLAVKP